MSALAARLALVGLACAVAAPASAQLLQRKDLSYAIAKTIAENALADCKARGYAPGRPEGPGDGPPRGWGSPGAAPRGGRWAAPTRSRTPGNPSAARPIR